jgi:glutamyl-tRNA reductase
MGEKIYTLTEPQSLQHLFKVACGLDSMVLGETEILGQLKDAYALAHRHGYTGMRLNKAFQRAFHAAKHVRTHTSIQRGSISVASAAVELAEKIFSSLRGREVLVIGAGDTSEKTARALFSRGVRNIVIASRSLERAQVLAREFAGRTVPFEHWAAEFEKIDIVITSTSAPHHILDRVRLEPLMKARQQRPLLLIDIAVPRDIDPEVNFLENVYLYNIDDLQAIADGYLKQRKDEISRCEQIIAEKVDALLGLKNLQPRMDTDEHGYGTQTGTA